MFSWGFVPFYISASNVSDPVSPCFFGIVIYTYVCVCVCVCVHTQILYIHFCLKQVEIYHGSLNFNCLNVYWHSTFFFSCSYFPSEYTFQWNVCPHLLLIFQLDTLAVTAEFSVIFIYSRHEYFVRYVFYRYILPVCSSSFHFLIG